ncbi:hypothetical protein GALMADRAFT_278763 [Galerina marginata CBS 339.88]|uniref:Uncharacterized protein n=1 Tax=Galerina marginata (strain CBS 339.88) TaxID=685588 RepID=A0A067TCU6_GALM3|nr:hypothetical protein GALMADRAFT_278763 [Galerina marginata CBS 339.88]
MAYISPKLTSAPELLTTATMMSKKKGQNGHIIRIDPSSSRNLLIPVTVAINGLAVNPLLHVRASVIDQRGDISFGTWTNNPLLLPRSNPGRISISILILTLNELNRMLSFILDPRFRPTNESKLSARSPTSKSGPMRTSLTFAVYVTRSLSKKTSKKKLNTYGEKFDEARICSIQSKDPEGLSYSERRYLHNAIELEPPAPPETDPDAKPGLKLRLLSPFMRFPKAYSVNWGSASAGLRPPSVGQAGQG